MTGLESVEVFVYLEPRMRVPSTEEEWVSRIFSLQHGPNGLRDLKIQVIYDRSTGIPPLPGAGWIFPAAPLTGTPQAPTDMERLELRLQEMVRKGAESHIGKGEIAADAGPNLAISEDF